MSLDTSDNSALWFSDENR